MLKPIRSARRQRAVLIAAAGLTVAVGAGAPTGALAAALKTTGFVADIPTGFVSLTASHDARQLKTADVAYTMKCNDSSTFTDWDGFKAVPISASGALTSKFDTGPQTSTSLPGATVQFAGQLTGKLNKAHNQIKGTFRFISAIKRSDGTTLSCDTGVIGFTARD